MFRFDVCQRLLHILFSTPCCIITSQVWLHLLLTYLACVCSPTSTRNIPSSIHPRVLIQTHSRTRTKIPGSQDTYTYKYSYTFTHKHTCVLWSVQRHCIYKTHTHTLTHTYTHTKSHMSPKISRFLVASVTVVRTLR